MTYFSRLLLLATLGGFTIFPMLANRFGWGVSSERDASIIASASQCAPEFRDSQGKCLASSRSIRSRRSVFGGSYGHGK